MIERAATFGMAEFNIMEEWIAAGSGDVGICLEIGRRDELGPRIATLPPTCGHEMYQWIGLRVGDVGIGAEIPVWIEQSRLTRQLTLGALSFGLLSLGDPRQGSRAQRPSRDSSEKRSVKSARPH